MKQFLAAHPRPPMSAAAKAGFLRFSRCMRAHGVPNFPDPTFSPTGSVGIGPGPGTDVNSPAFQHAQQVCGNPEPSRVVRFQDVAAPCSTAALPVTTSDRLPPAVSRTIRASATEQLSTARPGPRGLA